MPAPVKLENRSDRVDSFQEAGRVTADGERPAFNNVKSAATTPLTDQGSEKRSYTYFRPRPQTTREISSFFHFF
jgi:hypothetical protein